MAIKTPAQGRTHPYTYVYAVATNCDCEDDYCTGYAGVDLFDSEQTAKQYAEHIYGGRYLGRQRVRSNFKSL